MNEIYDIKILIIDDEEDVREIIKRNLEKYGYSNIELTGSIIEANKKFKHEHFDIMTVDMRFDGKDEGFEILKLADENEKIASNMIIFTANDCVVQCRQAFKMGAWDYIPKHIQNGNSYEELHLSIQDSIKHTKEWGNAKDTTWISEHIDELIENYDQKYIAVMDKEVIGMADSEEELHTILKDKNSPTIMPMIFKVQS